MSRKNYSAIRRKLLRWYDRVRRDLPWRRSRDPYAIWVAETMLQQTQVSTVIPYYDRFLRAFPTIHALDRASLQRVLACWSGLGYYRRAENLKKSAQLLVQQHGGLLPADYRSLLALPGVGDYTAGAVMSIAFDKPFPALDGNARRVLGRIFHPKDEKELRKIADQLVPVARPGYFNQGLMELGATLCVPKTPRCPICPVASSCVTRASRRAPESFASKRGRPLRKVTWPLIIFRQGKKFLLRRRPAAGVLAGLWEFPGGEQKPEESLAHALGRHSSRRAAVPRRRIQIGAISHAITTKKIRAPVFFVELPPDAAFEPLGPAWRWLSPAALRRYPVSSMTRKALGVLSRYEESLL